MGMELKIHIFCETSDLFKLIKKSFTKESYIFTCTEVKDKKLQDITKEISYRPDCIIVDNDIDSYFRDEIVKKFLHNKIVLLPSLDDVELNPSAKNVFQISEPFKLSELGEVLKEIYHSKQSEEFIN
jgi:hypothetical protein